MLNQFSRTELLFGGDAMEKLKKARVAVFGIGGVGGHTMEALARSGIGALDLIDNDTVSVTNINRQIIATVKTIGKSKVEVAKQRCLEINPDINIVTHNIFFTAETAGSFDFSDYDYVVDAIDTVTAKLKLIECSKKAGVPIICAMGAGNKIDPTAFKVADISKTSCCPLAKVMRVECRKRGLKNIKCVYSDEIPLKPAVSDEASAKRQIPGSNAFVPSVAGLIIAGEVIKDIIKTE